MHQIARQLGLDPLDLRLRNLVEPGDVDALTGRSIAGCSRRRRGSPRFAIHRAKRAQLSRNRRVEEFMSIPREPTRANSMRIHDESLPRLRQWSRSMRAGSSSPGAVALMRSTVARMS